MSTQKSIIPIYTTKGDADAFIVYPYLYNRTGEWIGWITSERDIYSVIGQYVGFLGNGPRILRKRAIEIATSEKTPPSKPPKIRLPATVPLAPMMAELNHSEVDVLQDEPERLHTADSGEFRQDMD